MSGTEPAVLIVEDEALIALLLDRQLRRFGVKRVDQTPSGEGAVVAAAAQDYDLVFMDIHLAGAMSGIEAAALIMDRPAHPDIAFMTAFGDAASRAAAVALRPAAFLEKPLTAQAVRDVLAASRLLPAAS
jgi:CheY-like chemotaxis protein